MSTLSPTIPNPKRFAELQERLTDRLSAEWKHAVPRVLIRRSVSEAVEIAATTGFPELFLPELAAEQVRRVSYALAPEESLLVQAA
jgi:hypothetical protein